MSSKEILDWLFENGGPSIRYRTAVELLDEGMDIDLNRLTVELLESPLVKLWLERLVPNTGPNQLHSSKPTAYENAMGKLVLLGCRCGMEPFDKWTQPFRSWLKHQLANSSDIPFDFFYPVIVGAFLVMAGYHQDQTIQDLLTQRLDMLFEFTRQSDYDIYVDQNAYSGIPKAFRNQPLVNPELNTRLPTIHDIRALAYFPDGQKDAATQRKISSVINYVLHADYQRFREGYGIVKMGRRKYYAMGWSVHLPGYDSFEFDNFKAGQFVQRLALMAHFPTAVQRRWFRENLVHLEKYRTERGTYMFPCRYLRECRRGYWVMGAYMGLEENRRSQEAIELESTFWMFKIRKLVEQSLEGES